MANRRAVSAGLSAVLSFAITACESATPIDPLVPVGEPAMAQLVVGSAISEQEARAIISSPEGRVFIAIAQEPRQKAEAAVARGVKARHLRDLADQGDDIELGRILFGNVRAALAYGRRFEAARTRFLSAYPEIATLSMDSSDGASCAQDEGAATSPSMVMAMWDEEDEEPEEYDAEPPTCGSYWQQVKLAACAAAASWCGPTSLLCAWGCWCMLCSENSDLAEVMC